MSNVNPSDLRWRQACWRINRDDLDFSMSLATDLYEHGNLRAAGSIFLFVAQQYKITSPAASQDAFNALGAILARMAGELYPHQVLIHAAAAFRSALAINPQRCFGPAHHNLGIAVAEANQWDSAKAAYIAALRCEPQNPTYLYSLGAAHISAADPPHLALERFCAACGSAPRSEDAFLGLGYALRDAARPLAAAAAFAAARRLADRGCGPIAGAAAVGEFAAVAHAAAFDRQPAAAARAHACLLPTAPPAIAASSTPAPAPANLYELARLVPPDALLRFAAARATALLRAAVGPPRVGPPSPPPLPPRGGGLNVVLVSSCLAGGHYIAHGVLRLLRHLARPPATPTAADSGA
jgi:tetratricopeptide (TPR) repeat protein